MECIESTNEEYKQDWYIRRTTQVSCIESTNEEYKPCLVVHSREGNAGIESTNEEYKLHTPLDIRVIRKDVSNQPMRNINQFEGTISLRRRLYRINQ